MKKIITALFCSLTLCTFAQSDSISLGVGATNMVFYSLSTHTKTSVANDDWHIAFSARSVSGYSTFGETNRATAVLINEAYGLQLYRCPNQKLAQYASLDTTGWQNWQRMHNPDTTWTVGAFNVNVNFADDFNFGWGDYNGGSHNIIGDSSIYLIKMPDGSFKTFGILNLLYDTAFNVQYANLDGTGLTYLEVRKSPYATKNFVYLNVNSGALIDKEPAATDWDFVTLRYNNTAYNASNLTQDIGILTNDANNTYAASGTTAQQSCYYGSDYSNYINVIGKSWMSTPSDTVIPGLAYFVQTAGNSYKITITGFGGATTGVVNFTLNTCANTSGIADINNALDMAIYPVPASDMLNIKLSSTVECNTDVQLLDMTGRMIVSQSGSCHMGENTLTMNTASLQSGNYILSVSTSGSRVNRMVSIVK